MARTTERKKAAVNRRVVSFELTDDVLELLQKNAKANSAKSRHLRARDLIIDCLNNKDTDDLANLLGEIDAKVAGLKTMIQRLCYAVLVHAAEKPPTDANSWIRDYLCV